MHVNLNYYTDTKNMQRDEHDAIRRCVEQRKKRDNKDKFNVSCIAFSKSYMEDWNKNQLSQVTILRTFQYAV